MTDLELRLADYRRQVEAKDAEIRALIAHEHALFESLRRCRRVIDVLLERPAPGPKSERPAPGPKSERPAPGPKPGPEPKPEMVLAWNCDAHGWSMGPGLATTRERAKAFVFTREQAKFYAAGDGASYELQPVEVAAEGDGGDGAAGCWPHDAGFWDTGRYLVGSPSTDTSVHGEFAWHHDASGGETWR